MNLGRLLDGIRVTLFKLKFSWTGYHQMKLTVERDPKTSDNLATEGIMFVDGIKFCFTLEPGRQDPEHPKGPIPAGLYSVAMLFSPHFNKPMPHLENVPDFDYIMIHPGNWPKDTEGCILVGQTQGQDIVQSSDAAFSELLLKILDGLKDGLVYCEIIG